DQLLRLRGEVARLRSERVRLDVRGRGEAGRQAHAGQSGGRVRQEKAPRQGRAGGHGGAPRGGLGRGRVLRHFKRGGAGGVPEKPAAKGREPGDRTTKGGKAGYADPEQARWLISFPQSDRGRGLSQQGHGPGRADRGFPSREWGGT